MNMADITAQTPLVCIPMNIDAFILNKPVCDSGDSRIAPITQPDYLGLRPDKTQIRSDILPHVDVTASQPASTNSRISATESLQQSRLDPDNPQSDVPAAPPLRQKRIGVYVHWSLPRLYRAAISAADDISHASAKKPRIEYPNLSRSPQFQLVPNRWYIVRNIKSSNPEAPAEERRRAWVVHSDMIFDISKLGPEVDLETDVSPFVTDQGDNTESDVLNRQSSVYIGAKFPAEGWPQDVPRDSKRTILTAMNSSNFCFADNAVHNPNVFSIVDNFEYKDATNNTQYLDKVVCDYFVAGWHDDSYDDPLNFKTGMRGTLLDRLHALFLEPPSQLNPEIARSMDSGLIMCHGTIYNVQYDQQVKPETPADKFAKAFRPNSDIKMEPVSVGTTALDSILSFLRAHKGEGNALFGPGGASVAEDLLSLSQLLEASGDDYDSRVKAADLIYARNFAPSQGGRTWHYDGKAAPGGAPALPSSKLVPGIGMSERQLLRKASELQYQLDAAKRKLRYCRWRLFAVWWSFVSDVQNEDPRRILFYQNLVQKHRAEIVTLIGLISSPSVGLEAQVSGIVETTKVGDLLVPAPVQARSIPQATFFQRRDPTVCLVGMDSGWPTEYTGFVPVRIASNLEGPGTSIFPTALAPILSRGLSTLVHEAFVADDHGRLLGFKQWKGQPWCPLYMEWEANYYHVSMDKWSVSSMNSPVDNQSRVRYGIKEALSGNSTNSYDQTSVSGRAILLPHSGINLQALIEQVSNHPDITLSTEELEDLKANINKPKFAVAELEGLTTNLLTCSQGTHLQPNFTSPGSNTSHVIAPALAAAAQIGFTDEDFAHIADETALTPYGTLIDFSDAAASNPFKGTTHGQLRFTKLNVIDKFGQVISVIPPQPTPKDQTAPRSTIYPCLGDQICPGFVPGTNKLNTVTPISEVDQHLPNDYPLCPYIQLTPAINQDVRLNAALVLPQRDTIMNIPITRWRTADDWENPVFAWVVVNVADQALQFFTGDGVFYVEMSLGGAADQIKSPSWQPFDPPAHPSNTIVPTQLVQLIAELSHSQTGGSYLRAFWSMIAQSLSSMPFTPASYGTYPTSIIGRPLALVNAGFSLELALPPMESTVIPPLQPAQPPSSGEQPTEASMLYSYAFPIKIGDRERTFDGVVGYFNNMGNVTDWSKIYTYYSASSATETPESNDPRVGIAPENFDTLNPYYVPPEGPFGTQSFMKLHESRLKVKTLILDPFTAAHVYTPVLPLKSLRLSDWLVQTALEKMSRFLFRYLFFHPKPFGWEDLL
jgi:hypothetical protein